jgi:pimeloyl-ACP methyl ester carboxylesterase
MNFTPPYLGTIAARTLVVHGDRDPLFPVELAVEMYSAIPRSYLWVIPNRGHSFPREDAEMFLATVIPFLQESPPFGNAG